MLQAIERALAGENSAVGSLRLEPVGEQSQHWIMTQIIMVADILIAERDAGDPLTHQARQAMDNEIGRTVIDETAGNAIDQFDRPIGMSKQQCAGIRGHGAAFEIGDYTATADAFKFELLSSTVCRHRRSRLVPLSDCCNFTFADHGRRCTITGEKCGLERRLINFEPQPDSDEFYGCEEVLSFSVVARCDASELFELVE